jgi:hypothetical protein
MCTFSKNFGIAKSVRWSGCACQVLGTIEEHTLPDGATHREISEDSNHPPGKTFEGSFPAEADRDVTHPAIGRSVFHNRSLPWWLFLGKALRVSVQMCLSCSTSRGNHREGSWWMYFGKLPANHAALNLAQSSIQQIPTPVHSEIDSSCGSN